MTALGKILAGEKVQLLAAGRTDRGVHAAPQLLGRHDFSSFCATDSHARTKVRTLHELRLEQDDVMIEL